MAFLFLKGANIPRSISRLVSVDRLLTVVGGEAVDDVKVFPEGVHVLAGAKHGPDLRPPVANLGHVLLAQEEVVRRYLARDLDALLLGSADDQDLEGRREKFTTILSN